VTAWGKDVRHICFYTTSFVFISNVKVRFIYTTWPPSGRPSATLVYIPRHFRSRGHWRRRHVWLHHVTLTSHPFPKGDAVYSRSLRLVYRYRSFLASVGIRGVTLRKVFLQFNYLVNIRRGRDWTTFLTRDDEIVTRCVITRVQTLLESSFALF